MSRPYIYTTRNGDTFDSVARLTTGRDTNAASIKAANPGLVEPFEAGLRIEVPELVTDEQKNFNSAGIDLRVGGVPIVPYENFVLSMSIDGFRKLNFVLPNEIPTRDVVPGFEPVAVDMGYDGEQLFSGYLEPPDTQTERDKKALSVTASSYANLLNNRAPASAWPLAFKDADLGVIAESICSLFSLNTFFDVEPGSRFKKPSLQRDNKALDFLSRLAKQRNMVLTDDAFSSVIFTDGIATGAPILEIDDETRPDVVVKGNRSMRNYYSSITGILKGKTKRKQKEYTIQNPHFSGIIKTDQIEFSDIDEGELEAATRGAMGRMFANAFSVSVTVPGWRDKNGDIIQPGRPIRVRSPREYINDFFELAIRRVDLIGRSNQKITVMTCVLPGCFAGEIPENVPWVTA